MLQEIRENSLKSSRKFTASKVKELDSHSPWYADPDDDWGGSRQKYGWHKGTALYELSEAVCVNDYGFLTSSKYVIVAFTLYAVDHGQKETTVFAANADGTLFGGFLDKDGDEENWVSQMDVDDGAEFEECRVVGEFNPAAALKKLQWGFELK